MNKIALSVVLLFVLSSTTNAQESSDGTQDTSGAAVGKKLYPALLGGLSVNAIYHLTGRAFGARFAQTDLESMKTNLTSMWELDDNQFLFNHPGHPYQGAHYHIAARTNGFNFYESAFFNTLGSVTWELFGEVDQPSFNDLFVTVYGGLAFGEVLHRLYLEWDSPYAFLISPMDALNDLIQRKRQARTNNLYYFSVMTGGAWIESNKSPGVQFSKYAGKIITSELFTANIGFDVIYGDPYTQSSRIPFEHFEMRFQFGGRISRPPWLDWTIFTDGYLLSFNPLDTDKTALSNGLTLNYDLVTGSNTNFASNALAYSLKWRYDFTEDTQFSLKFHLGAVLFGSSHYYPDADVYDATFYLGNNSNDYGMGANARLSLSLSNRKIGTFSLFVFPNLLYLTPWAIEGVDGREFFNFTQFEYWYELTKRFSLGISNSLYLKSGQYKEHDDILEAANRIMLSARWTFMNKRLE